MESKPQETATIEHAAIWVVDAFDQANTAGAIETLGHRGCLLRDAVNTLRNVVNRHTQKTTLTADQAL